MMGASERAARPAGSPIRRSPLAVLPMAMRALPQASLPLEAELSPAPWVVSMPRGDATAVTCVGGLKALIEDSSWHGWFRCCSHATHMIGMPRGRL